MITDIRKWCRKLEHEIPNPVRVHVTCSWYPVDEVYVFSIVPHYNSCWQQRCYMVPEHELGDKAMEMIAWRYMSEGMVKEVQHD